MAIEQRSAWDWELQARLDCEQAAKCLQAGKSEIAAAWSNLAILAMDLAAEKRRQERQGVPLCVK